MRSYYTSIQWDHTIHPSNAEHIIHPMVIISNSPTFNNKNTITIRWIYNIDINK